MAVSIVLGPLLAQEKKQPGQPTQRLATITFDADYAVAGEPVTAADFGFDQLLGIRPINYSVSTWNVFYQSTLSNLVAWAVAAVVAEHANLSTLVVTVIAIGY